MEVHVVTEDLGDGDLILGVFDNKPLAELFLLKTMKAAFVAGAWASKRPPGRTYEITTYTVRQA